MARWAIALLLAATAHAGQLICTGGDFTLETGGTLTIVLGVDAGVSGNVAVTGSCPVILMGTLTIGQGVVPLTGLPYGSHFHLFQSSGAVAGYTDPTKRALVWPALPLDWYVVYGPHDVWLVKTRIQHRVTLR
jgi:hypothetical protein